MGRGTIKQAEIYSVNEFQFSSPYDRPQRTELTLRIHPEYGRDVILTIDRGQFLCSSYNRCQVVVRFDEGKAESYSASEPADHRTTTLFIRNYPRFVSNLRRAKKLFIQAEFYQEGSRVFEFDVAGLAWDEKTERISKAPIKKTEEQADSNSTPAAAELDLVRERLINEAIERGKSKLAGQ
jgi:hypothetical protein